MQEKLALTVIRGAESWQFFAFVFAAVLVLAFGLIEELPSKASRLVARVVSFLLVGYFTLISAWGRNLLVALLDAFKTEAH